MKSVITAGAVDRFHIKIFIVGCGHNDHTTRQQYSSNVGHHTYKHFVVYVLDKLHQDNGIEFLLACEQLIERIRSLEGGMSAMDLPYIVPPELFLTH